MSADTILIANHEDGSPFGLMRYRNRVKLDEALVSKGYWFIEHDFTNDCKVWENQTTKRKIFVYAVEPWEDYFSL
jgi:hypothetical protein